MMNSQFLKLCTAALVAFVLTACTTVVTKKSDSIKIQRLIFFNASNDALNGVEIFITKTRESVTCGYILPNTECSVGFPLRKYQGNRFDVTWNDNGKEMSVTNMLVVVPEALNVKVPVNAVITIGEYGRLTASLKN